MKPAAYIFPATFLASVYIPLRADVIGTVVNAQGMWCDAAYFSCDASHALWKMYPVQSNSRLTRFGQVNSREFIEIRSRWGVLEKFDCLEPRELGCKDPLNLSRLIPPEKKPTVVSAFFDAIFALASAKPKLYDTLQDGILRRGSQGPLSDGVAELRPGGVDLRSVLADWDAGDYLLEICPLSEDAAPRCPVGSQPVVYRWNPKQPALFPAANVHPGLYRLFHWENRLGVSVRGANYGDVLLSESPAYNQLGSEFQRVLNATRDWDSTDSTAPTLRRIYLHTLAPQ